MFLAQKEIEVDGESYILKTFPAMTGLGIQHRLGKDGMTPELTQYIIMEGATKGSVTIDAKDFNKRFAGKYAHMFRLLGEVMKFNFPDMEDEDLGNDQSDSSES